MIQIITNILVNNSPSLLISKANQKMMKQFSKDFSKLSNKENKFQTPSETPQSSSRNTAYDFKDQPRSSSRAALGEHDSNVKSSLPRTDRDYKIKMSTTFGNKVEDSATKNGELELEITQLQRENKSLEETVEDLRNQVENYKIFEDKAEELQRELDRNMIKILNYDKLQRELEELKKEKERLIINFDKEKTSLESRNMELKEQLQLKDQKIEQRITSEHNNRFMLNANLNRMLDQNDKWKKLFMLEAKNVISLQQQYKSLVEDNKCHLEYIGQLENKIQQLETNYYDLYTDYHQRLTEYRIENLKNTQAELERIRSDFTEEEFEKVEERMMINALQNELNKEKEVSLEYKNQMERLVEVRQELERNLAMSRHNALDLSGKLEEESAKVAALEDMRINDLQYISNLESGL